MASLTVGPGSVVGGRFRLERLLGEGGMGAVFAAQNTVTGKRVAIKWMHPEVAANPDASARFIREAQVCARLQHPNVVDVYDVLTEEASLFLVMELLDGEPLTELLKREATALPHMISLLLDAMRGVAAAHAQGIVHRDIKPDNIFLAREGGHVRPVPKVLDFGISKLTGTTDVSLTQTGAALGTPLYMSVEQLSGVRDIDARTDIYAFGVILYQAVTGHLPFDAETFPVLITKIMTEQAISPKALRPEIPLALSRLIEWAMAKDRSARIASIEEFIRELEPFSTELGFRGQMTVGSSDIPSVRTPGSITPAERAAAAAMPRSKPPTSLAAQGTLPPTKSRVPSPDTFNPVVTTDASSQPVEPVPGRRRNGAAAVLVGVFALVALLIGVWWISRAEPAAPAVAHVVLPAVVSSAPVNLPTPVAQPANVAPAIQDQASPAQAPAPAPLPKPMAPLPAAHATHSARAGAHGSPAKDDVLHIAARPSAAPVAPVATTLAPMPAPPPQPASVKADKKAASGFRAGAASRDEF